jgi:glucokinase
MGWLAREAVASGVASASAAFVGLAGSLDAVRGEHVVAAARSGDADALAVLASFGDWLGLGLANLVNVLDSEIVVVGGGVSEEADLFLDHARQRLRALALGGEHRPRVPLVAARLGERAGAVGAALLAALRT